MCLLSGVVLSSLTTFLTKRSCHFFYYQHQRDHNAHSFDWGSATPSINTYSAVPRINARKGKKVSILLCDLISSKVFISNCWINWLGRLPSMIGVFSSINELVAGTEKNTAKMIPRGTCRNQKEALHTDHRHKQLYFHMTLNILL